MASIAKAFVQGNLTADPEERKTPSGKTVVGLRVAVNHNWTDGDGNKQEDASFFGVSVFGKQGDNCAKYLHKGDEITVIGRLDQRRWTDDAGLPHERVEIKADDVVFGTKAKRGGDGKSAE